MSGISQPKSEVSETNWAVFAALRYFLACVVLCGHEAFFLNLTPPLAKIAAVNGSYAVLLFLFISGFSIAHSAQAKPQGYASRRAWRILPVYCTCVSLSFLSVVCAHHLPLKQPYDISSLSAPKLWPTLAGVLSFGLLHHVDTDGPVWSLGIEIVWYTLAPLLLRTRSVLLVFIIIASSTFAYVVQEYSLPNAHSEGMEFLRASWAWVLGFFYYRYRLARWACLVPFFPCWVVSNYTVGYDAGGAMMTQWFALAVVVASNIGEFPAAVRSALQWLGDVSYPLYLIHMPVFWFLLALRITPSSEAAFLLALGTAVMVYYAVDLPSRRIAKRLKRTSLMLREPPVHEPETAATIGAAVSHVPVSHGHP